MRWKLLLVVALLAALVSVGLSFAALQSLDFFDLASHTNNLAASALLSLATIIFSAFFVYRHTARRRRLQALLNGICAVILTLALFALLARFEILPQLVY